MAHQDLQDIFDQCLDLMSSGASIEDCLRRFPEHQTELRPLLETARLARTLTLTEDELNREKALVWQKIERQLPPFRSGYRRYPGLLPMVLAASMMLFMTGLFLAQILGDLVPVGGDDDRATFEVIPTESTGTETDTTATPSPTMTMTATASPTASATGTATPTASPSVTATPSVTENATTTSTASSTATPTSSQTSVPTATYVPGCGAPFTVQDAIARVLEVYPNTSITSAKITEKFGGVAVWEIKTSHGIEVNVDVGCGNILTIEQESEDPAVDDPGSEGSGPASSNANDNDDDDDHSNDNFDDNNDNEIDDS